MIDEITTLGVTMLLVYCIWQWVRDNYALRKEIKRMQAYFSCTDCLYIIELNLSDDLRRDDELRWCEKHKKEHEAYECEYYRPA